MAGNIWLPDNVVLGAVGGTETWFNERRGLVTASRFGDVISEPRSVPANIKDTFSYLVQEERYKILKSGLRAGQKEEVSGYGDLVKSAMERIGEYVWGDTAKSYMMELLAAVITGNDAVGGKSAAMERGVDKESDAIDRYSKERFIEVGAGRLVRMKHELVAATPDGFLPEDPNGDEDGPGLLECKCPESKRHLQTFLERALPDDYLEQVHGQMAVCGRTWCDFISYDDRFPQPMQLVVVRVKYDPELGDRMMKKVRRFAKLIEDKLAGLKMYLDIATPEEAAVVVQALRDSQQTLTSQPEAE